MNIPIGKKIRELRANKSATQEQLATFLGVTPQAVSRWESQYAYPDIELLPAIADYFAVTTDELLGVRKDERELRLAEIKTEIDRLQESGGTKEIVALARQAAAEFPAEETIRLHLAESLQRLMFDEEAEPDEQKVEASQNVVPRGKSQGTCPRPRAAGRRERAQAQDCAAPNRLRRHAADFRRGHDVPPPEDRLFPRAHRLAASLAWAR